MLLRRVVAPALTPDSYTQVRASDTRLGCSSLLTPDSYTRCSRGAASKLLLSPRIATLVWRPDQVRL